MVGGGGAIGAILGKRQAHEADKPECGPDPDLEGTRVSEVTSLSLSVFLRQMGIKFLYLTGLL